jgi:hypothetical protein
MITGVASVLSAGMGVLSGILVARWARQGQQVAATAAEAARRRESRRGRLNEAVTVLHELGDVEEHLSLAVLAGWESEYLAGLRSLGPLQLKVNVLCGFEPGVAEDLDRVESHIRRMAALRSTRGTAADEPSEVWSEEYLAASTGFGEACRGAARRIGALLASSE